MTDRKDSQIVQSSDTGFFARLKNRLTQRLGIRKLDWLAGRQFNETLAEELEDQLLLADVGVDATQRIIADLRRRSPQDAGSDSASLRQLLREILLEILQMHHQKRAV